MQLHLQNALNVRSAFALLALMTSAAVSCNSDDDNTGNGNEGGTSTVRGGSSGVGGSSAKGGSSAVNRGGSSGTTASNTGGTNAAGTSTTSRGGSATSGGTSAAAGSRATGGATSPGGASASAGRANAGSSGRAVGGTSGGSATAGHAGVATSGHAGVAGGSWTTGGSASAGRSSTAGEAGAAGASAASTFTMLYDSVISTRCLTCHSPGGGGVSVGMLDLSTRANAFTNLVGASGTGVAAQGTGAGSSNVTCASVSNLLRVVPGNATGSLLWQKVNSKLQGVSAPCGNPMPAGSGAALTQQQIDAIAGWINSGAHND